MDGPAPPPPHGLAALELAQLLQHRQCHLTHSAVDGGHQLRCEPREHAVTGHSVLTHGEVEEHLPGGRYHRPSVHVGDQEDVTALDARATACMKAPSARSLSSAHVRRAYLVRADCVPDASSSHRRVSIPRLPFIFNLQATATLPSPTTGITIDPAHNIIYPQAGAYLCRKLP